MDSELLRTVVAALDSAGVPHMVTGSFASTLHGEPRATRDLDLVIDPRLETIKLFVSAFPADRFYVSDADEAVRTRGMFNIVDTDTGWKIDLIVRKSRPYSAVEFDRRQPVRIAGVDTFVTTAEDAILSKLEWQTMTPSDTQRRDVVQMMIVNEESLDRSYMQQWAENLGVEALLGELWNVARQEP